MNKTTTVQYRKAPTTPYQITGLAIEICKLRNVTSDEDIKEAVRLARNILFELDVDIHLARQPSESSEQS